MADTDDCIAGYRRLAETVHAHGTVLFGQLFHDGREMMESQDGSLSVALAPSAVPTERFHVMPRAMPVPLVEEIVGVLRFSRPAVAGRRARRRRDRRFARLPAGTVPQPAGQRAHRPVRRAQLENRLRFLREVIASVREHVGRDFVVGIRDLCLGGDRRRPELRRDARRSARSRR